MLVLERPRGVDRGERPALDLRVGASSASSAAANAAATAGSTSSTRSPSGTTRRSGGAGAAAAAGGAPRSSASSTTASATLVASGPTLSSVGASGRMPARSTRAAVGLKPTSPQNAAGTRIEPDVSVPIAHGDDAARDRHRRARRGTARDPRRAAAVRVARRAEVRVQAEPGVRELGQVRLADADHPRGREPRDDRRVGARRRGIAPQRRSRRRRDALDVDQVLPRDRDAVERPERRSGAQPRGARGGLAQRALLGQRDERAAGVARPRERLLGQRDGVELAGGEQPAGLERGARQAAAATSG